MTGQPVVEKDVSETRKDLYDAIRGIPGILPTGVLFFGSETNKKQSGFVYWPNANANNGRPVNNSDLTPKVVRRIVSILHNLTKCGYLTSHTRLWENMWIDGDGGIVLWPLQKIRKPNNGTQGDQHLQKTFEHIPGIDEASCRSATIGITSDQYDRILVGKDDVLEVMAEIAGEGDDQDEESDSEEAESDEEEEEEEEEVEAVLEMDDDDAGVSDVIENATAVSPVLLREMAAELVAEEEEEPSRKRGREEEENDVQSLFRRLKELGATWEKAMIPDDPALCITTTDGVTIKKLEPVDGGGGYRETEEVIETDLFDGELPPREFFVNVKRHRLELVPRHEAKLRYRDETGAIVETITLKRDSNGIWKK